MLTSLKVNSRADKKRKEDDPRQWSGSPLYGMKKYKPLPAMLAAFDAMIAARGDKDWKQLGYQAVRVCDHWANLTEQDRAGLAPAFPNAPDFLGEWSGLAWVAFLTGLVSVERRRECARRSIRLAVERGGGERLSPAEWESICSNYRSEPPF